MFRFRTSPIEIKGDGKVESIVLGRNELVADDTGRVSAKDTGEREEVPAQLVVRAVGYRGVATPGLPFDDKNGTIPHSSGRVEGSRNEYVVGWIKRGPTGVIGSNKSDSQETVDTLVGDLADADLADFAENHSRGAGGMVCRAAAEGRHRRPLEAHRRPRAWRRWHRGRPRVKLTSVAELLRIAPRLTPDSHVRTLHRISSPRGRPLARRGATLKQDHLGPYQDEPARDTDGSEVTPRRHWGTHFASHSPWSTTT